jgi:hypothetical protein
MLRDGTNKINPYSPLTARIIEARARGADLEARARVTQGHHDQGSAEAEGGQGGDPGHITGRMGGRGWRVGGTAHAARRRAARAGRHGHRAQPARGSRFKPADRPHRSVTRVSVRGK